MSDFKRVRISIAKLFSLVFKAQEGLSLNIDLILQEKEIGRVVGVRLFLWPFSFERTQKLNLATQSHHRHIYQCRNNLTRPNPFNFLLILLKVAGKEGETHG